MSKEKKKNRAIFSSWVKALDGPGRVARKIDIDESTIWRYETGKQEIPKLLLMYILQSEEIAEIKQENARLKRKK